MNPHDFSRVRLPLEAALLDRLAVDLAVLAPEERVALAPDQIRRQLLGRAVRLTDAMAPVAVRTAEAVRAEFGLCAPVEIYQSAGRENAAMHLLRDPILMEIQGRLLSLLDEGALRAVIGHEFGHYMAHGPDSLRAEVGAQATTLALSDSVAPELSMAASCLCMARELTADRFALLATRDLHALLRLEMVATTGLPAEALGRDTEGYLDQCRELVEACLDEADTAMGVTHPEHGVRAWAAWLFSESDLFREMTGAGPGTRPIAEVEALIERVLRRPGIDGSYHYLDVPPPELHEAALAAAALVGSADGVLGDEEAEAIEKTFAALVPEWRRFLEPAFAAQRLQELAPVAAAFGPGFQRPLFNLLMNVLVADGVAEAAEFQRITEIGRILGCEELFESLMRGALRRLTVERRENVASKPLPVSAQDALQALDSFLVATVRRGGGQVTVRRLLRLLGAGSREPELLHRIAAAVSRYGLKASIDLASAGLEDSVSLLPVAVVSASDAAVRPTPGALERAIQRLRDELISGDGHSPSVRLREIRSGRSFDLAELNRISVGQAERVLAMLGGGKRAVLVEGEQVGASREAETLMRQVVELRREHLARLEETGARDLFLGTGFICGAVDGYVVRAPLLLQQVELERAGEGGIALVPLADEPPIANQAVLRAVYHKAGLPFGEETAAKLAALAGDSTKGVAALVEHLRGAGIDVFEVTPDLHKLDPLADAVYEWKGRRLELEACAVVGLFPQSNSELLEDYEQLLADIAKPGADLGELLGCARELLPAALRDSLRVSERAARELHLPVVPVIPSDPSQVAVVRMAREVPALVVDGPPGTGKSQVIVNLVADAVARGERVAVVSEKRAALDVVANRLTHAGLGELTGVVHDVFEDRKTLYRRISARLTKDAAEAGAPQASVASGDRESIARDLRQRIAHLRQANHGEPTLGALAAYAAGFQVMVPTAMPRLGHLTAKSALQLARVADSVRPWSALLLPGSPWRPTEGRPVRRSLAGTTREERAEMRTLLSRVVQTKERVERAATEQPASPSACLQSAPIMRTALASLGRLTKIEPLVAQLLGASSDDSARSLAGLRLEWQAEAGVWQSEPLPVRMQVDPDLEPALVVLLAKGDSFLRIFSPAWWNARGAVRNRLPLVWPDAVGRPLDVPLARDLHRRMRLARLWKRLDDAAARDGLRDCLSGDAREIARILDRAADVAEPVLALRNVRPVLESLNAWAHSDFERWCSLLSARLAAAEAQQAHEVAAREASGVFHGIDAATGMEQLQQLLAKFSEEADRAADMDRVLTTAEAIDSQGSLVLALCSEAGPEVRWGDIVTKAWATARVAAHEGLPPRLRGAECDDSGTRQLADVLDADAIGRRQLAVARANETPLIRLPPPEKHARRTLEQAAKEKLQREAAKQRALMPLRTFVRTYADAGLFDALPVWLLSPETLTVLFPRRPIFDLVIFDEASQCTVASGFPALMRARRVVIAGDDRQMPPTSFFKAAPDEEEAETQASQGEAADFLDAESLLTLARQRAPKRSLDWHYRCREEELIAFSNHAMYGGALLTCPSQATPLVEPALRWVAVADAVYAEGRNEKEAERVVDLLHDALRRKPAPTVGVVTFNLSQRRTVLDAIDRRRANDPEFARVFSEAETRELLDDRPFVKNIENVQGDERDIIIFSVGHAPVERRHRTRGVERYVPARFGPVGQRGGERRLNVAVSRARAEALVVASFEPSMLSVARAKNDGPRLFKAYLEYVYHLSANSRTLAHRVLDLVRSASEAARVQAVEPLPNFVPLSGQIAEALLSNSRRAIVKLGSSGFRVDVAVEGKNGRAYQLAILCDDGSYEDGAFRRTQRAALLRRRGWRIVHVDSVEWMENRHAVLQRIDRALME
ncbi:MAG: DUF4011 domain-containing protein [Opitutae bacterium]|nr:DUF4011 domain-containing protein [Opitutae bacterium]